MAVMTYYDALQEAVERCESDGMPRLTYVDSNGDNRISLVNRYSKLPNLAQAVYPENRYHKSLYLSAEDISAHAAQLGRYLQSHDVDLGALTALIRAERICTEVMVDECNGDVPTKMGDAYRHLVALMAEAAHPHSSVKVEWNGLRAMFYVDGVPVSFPYFPE